jgi:hypothetical protein
MKSLKFTIIINSVLVALAVYVYYSLALPSFLEHPNFDGIIQRGKDGSSDIIPMFSLLIVLIVFYVYNIRNLIVYKKSDFSKISKYFMIFMILALFGTNSYIGHKKNQFKKAHIHWAENVKTKEYQSKKMNIYFTYTEETPKGKKVFIEEKDNEILIYSEINKQKIDRIIQLQKDPDIQLYQHLNNIDKNSDTKFHDYQGFFNDTDFIQVLDIGFFTNELLEKLTGLSFSNLKITGWYEIDMYFLIPKNNPSIYYVIISNYRRDKIPFAPNKEHYKVESWHYSFGLLEKNSTNITQ